MSKVLIAVIGPTAIGKTKRAISLANHFNTEILSADSRQFYKEMRVGTAVPSTEELSQAKHHFIQHISIFDTYTVGDYEKDALNTLKSQFLHNDIQILVGGSGLFVDSVLYGLDAFPKIPIQVRDDLNTLFKEHGITVLQEQLKIKDPNYYSKVDLENPHRLIRALEVCIASGQPYSSFLNSKRNNREFEFILVGIQADRDIIYDRINRRVDFMIDQGLVEEARELHTYKNLNALNTVGYKELFRFFEGEYSLDEATEEIKKNTRRFAKRQLTWYRKNPEVLWLNHNMSDQSFIDAVQEKLNKVRHAKK